MEPIRLFDPRTEEWGILLRVSVSENMDTEEARGGTRGYYGRSESSRRGRAFRSPSPQIDTSSNGRRNEVERGFDNSESLGRDSGAAHMVPLDAGGQRAWDRER